MAPTWQLTIDLSRFSFKINIFYNFITKSIYKFGNIQLEIKFEASETYKKIPSFMSICAFQESIQNMSATAWNNYGLQIH